MDDPRIEEYARLEVPAPIDKYAYDTVDAWMHIGADEVPHEGADLPHDREQAYAKMIRPFTARRLSLQMPWVGCRYPTQAQADEAGMTLEEFAEFFFSPVEGVVEFSEFPAAESGHECEDVRLVFTGGRVVEASARTDDGGKLFLDGELVQENGRCLS